MDRNGSAGFCRLQHSSLPNDLFLDRALAGATAYPRNSYSDFLSPDDQLPVTRAHDQPFQQEEIPAANVVCHSRTHSHPASFAAWDWRNRYRSHVIRRAARQPRLFRVIVRLRGGSGGAVASPAEYTISRREFERSRCGIGFSERPVAAPGLEPAGILCAGGGRIRKRNPLSFPQQRPNPAHLHHADFCIADFSLWRDELCTAHDG